MQACNATGGIADWQPFDIASSLPHGCDLRCRAFASNTKQSVKSMLSYLGYGAREARAPGHLRRTPLVHTHTHRRYGRFMFHNSVTRCVCVRAGACNRIPTCASPCVAVRTPSSSARASALNTPPWRRHSRVHAAVPAASLRGFALRACAASSSARAITSSATIRPDLVAPSIESM